MRNASIGLWGGLMCAGLIAVAAAAPSDGTDPQHAEVGATSVVSTPVASGVDAKLLSMLRANGSITADQYAELSADLAREQRRATRDTVDKTEFTEMQQKLSWATNTVVSGDVRVRQDRIEISGRPQNITADRQRIRARLGAVSQVTPAVEAGIRVASGSNNDVRSTNQDLDLYFTKKDIWLDRAYVNWHPTSVPGLKMFGGKMGQPWFNVADAMWDSDINPEGIAGQYNRKFGATNVFGSMGAFQLKNNVDGRGNPFTHDLWMQYGQLATNLYPGEDFKVTVGASIYHYKKDEFGVPNAPGSSGNPGLMANGNTSNQFQLYEGFGQLDVLGLPLPLTLIGQFIKNAAANGPQAGADAAWLAGFNTRVWELALSYNYRDIGRNGVVGAFTDSDFAGGFTASRGSTYRVSYNITNNFVFQTTYMDAESNAATPAQPGSEVDTLMIDLVATF